MKRSPVMVGALAALVTVGIWTAFIIIARASASHTLLPQDIVFTRLLGAGAVLLPWALWRTRMAPAPGAGRGSLGGLSPLPLGLTLRLGLLGGVMYALLSYSGFFFAPASHASVLLPGSLPLWTSLLAWWWLAERFGRARLLGLLLIVAGDLLVGGRSLLEAFDGGQVWRGDLLFMAASLSWSAYTVLVRRHHLDAVQATMATTAMAFVVFVPLHLLGSNLLGMPSRLLQAPWSELLFQALFQGVGSVVISGITFVMMVRHFGPVRSTMITALVPGLSALGAVLLLGEPLSWQLLAGLVLVSLGIVAGVWLGRPGRAA
ncbi:MAG: hypothetical protein RIQ38_240 [Pseudomonadota bacterium]